MRICITRHGDSANIILNRPHRALGCSLITVNKWNRHALVRAVIVDGSGSTSARFGSASSRLASIVGSWSFKRGDEGGKVTAATAGRRQ